MQFIFLKKNKISNLKHIFILKSKSQKVNEIYFICNCEYLSKFIILQIPTLLPCEKNKNLCILFLNVLLSVDTLIT